MDLLEKLSYPEEIITKKRPCNINLCDEHLFDSKYNDILLKVFPIKLKKCFISPNGYLFKNFILNKEQINLWIGYKNLFKLYLKSLISILNFRKKKRIKKAIYVTNTNSINFFHWFLDVLQKLEFISKISDFKLEIIIPFSHIDYYKKDSLKTFDLNFYYQKKNEIIFLDELILLPDIGDTTGNYRKELVLKLRNRLRNYWLKDLDTNFKLKRIYITRKNANRRRIINENKIFPILKKLNFHIVDFDTLNFQEQIKYILNCEVLVSMHGAGLTHMLWMKEKGKILEIRARDSKENCYFCLASDLNHDYYYSFADKINFKRSNTDSDFLIDEKHFISQMEVLI